MHNENTEGILLKKKETEIEEDEELEYCNTIQ
jgi:hypothetical protein